MSLREKTEDKFWFSFFHETGHVYLQHRKKELYINDGVADYPQEKEADAFAADWADFPRLGWELEVLPGSHQRFNKSGLSFAFFHCSRRSLEKFLNPSKSLPVGTNWTITPSPCFPRAVRG